ncbi:MAG: transglycosylase SLT domain-containing protein, partial [Candidatus Krumholzibacteriia bacterium]
LPLFGPHADDGTALQLGGVARTWLEAQDLAQAPFSAEVRSALGAVVLPRADLAEHFVRWPDPPGPERLQSWWTRGQRRLQPGDADHYESLAGRPDLAAVWRMDLWRRASERRLLADQWPAGLADLQRALDLAARPEVASGPSGLVRTWAEQAFVLALAKQRTRDAADILALARDQAAVVKDERFRWSVLLLASWLEGTPPAAQGDDRVDRLRLAVRNGAAADARPAVAADRARLAAAAAAPPWALWRRWGLALAETTEVADLRRAAAAAYGADLRTAADEAGLLAAALGRLSRHAGVVPRLAAWALDQDVHRRTGGATPPGPSPVPELAARLRGSQADLHALLGAALFLGDMRGTLGVASVLPGTGLTRDEKRRFLYPLPARGPVLDALLEAGDDPALLLAIARNESLFEPAVRSRAGALGWMQIMPFHYPERGAVPGAGHWSNPGVAIARGAALVAESRRRYGGDPYRLLAAYNAGPGAVERWDRQLGDGASRRLFLAWIGYTETRGYVEKVLVDRDLYDWILTEAAAPGAGLPAEE